MNLSKKFSVREKILLLILALLVIGSSYYLFVHRPVTENLASIELQTATVQDNLVVLQAQQELMQKMQTEIEEYHKSGEIGSEIPTYDNLQSVMNVLNSILSTSEQYNLSFSVSQPAEGENILRRVVNMSYTTTTYEQARQILNQLRACPYRCKLGDFSISPTALNGESVKNGSIENQPVTTNLSITFFERVEK